MLMATNKIKIKLVRSPIGTNQRVRETLKLLQPASRVPLLLRIDTPTEVDYFRHGGILPFVLRQLLAA